MYIIIKINVIKKFVCGKKMHSETSPQYSNSKYALLEKMDNQKRTEFLDPRHENKHKSCQDDTYYITIYYVIIKIGCHE